MLERFDAVVRGTGHEPVGFLTIRHVEGWPGPSNLTGELMMDALRDEVEDARRIDCADAPLWVVETEELSAEEATSSSARAPSRH